MKELLKKLIQAEATVQKGELAAAGVIADEFGKSGVDAAVDSWEQNRANVTAQIKSSGENGALLFACHLDVVGVDAGKWEYPPFAATEKEGRIYGRGAADMKGGTAAAVAAIRRIVDSGVELKGDIIFSAQAGEETDCCGVKRFVLDRASELPQLAGVIVPEPTGFDIVTAHRGVFWLKISTKGKAAHSSMPQLGVNAITSMKAVLEEMAGYKIRFEPHELLGQCSMSINTIAGGKDINVIADKCDITVDIRTLPGQNYHEIVEDVRGIFAKIKENDPQFEAEVSVIRDVEPLQTDVNCDFVKFFCSAVAKTETKAVGFTTDGPFFAALGVPVVVFGPGNPQLAHKLNEYIEIDDVEKAAEYYKEIILKFLT